MKEDLLKKWLNDELTDAEKEAFSKQEDYAFNQRIIDTAKYFKASNFSKADDFETFKKNYNGKTKVKQLHWVSPLLKTGIFDNSTWHFEISKLVFSKILGLSVHVFFDIFGDFVCEGSRPRF